MRRLTFEGYLDSYVPYLAGQATLSVSRLAHLAQSEPRLLEPLMLWAASTGRADRLAPMLSARRASELRMLAALSERGQLESTLGASGSPLRSEFTKVWASYTARRDASERDARLKLVARERVLALEASKGVTRYRMAKDLGLNPGNLHAFLSQANVSKVSLERAYELVDYLEAA